MALTKVSSTRCWAGLQQVHKHASATLGCDMKFSVYLPPQAEKGKCAVLVWLSGLTCTEQNLITKSGFQRYAAETGLIVVGPDTSPRVEGVAGSGDSWDFGLGAGFYVDATAEPFAKNFRMFSYVTKELLPLVHANFPTSGPEKVGVTGHSMGGHGAIMLHLRNPGLFKSVSAFAPIANPMQCPWGQKAFQGYFGDDKAKWVEHDSVELIKKLKPAGMELLVDQGGADEWLYQLGGDALKTACAEAGVKLTYNSHEGYDHGFLCVGTFLPGHFLYHAERLK